jgi:hypothetical protein
MNSLILDGISQDGGNFPMSKVRARYGQDIEPMGNILGIQNQASLLSSQKL